MAAKRRVVNGTIAGVKDWPGKQEYLRHINEKIAASKMSIRTITQQREILKYASVLKCLIAEKRQSLVEAHAKWLKSQSFTRLISVLPARLKNKDVLSLANTANTAICLKGMLRLDRFMKRGFTPDSKQAKKIIPILEKILVSNHSLQVKERALNLIFEYNLMACVPFIEWFSAHDKTNKPAIKTMARAVASKMRKAPN